MWLRCGGLSDSRTEDFEIDSQQFFGLISQGDRLESPSCLCLKLRCLSVSIMQELLSLAEFQVFNALTSSLGREDVQRRQEDANEAPIGLLIHRQLLDAMLSNPDELLQHYFLQKL